MSSDHGPLFAVLGTCLSLLALGCARDETASVHAPEYVREAFAAADLPLTELPLHGPDTTVVNPNGAPLPEALFGSGDRLNFYVVVYATADEAAQIAADAPAIDPVLGQPRAFLRDGNVLAVVQPPDEELVARIEPIIAGLS